MDPASGDLQQRQVGVAPRQPRIFLSYRTKDGWAPAELLYERLVERFGSENVFLDARELQPGMKWEDEIKSHRASCDVILALIGPQWVSMLKARDHEAIVDPAEDYMRSEIEYALKPDSGIRVIPVLMGDDVPFAGEVLPRSLQPLTKIEVARVRQKQLDEDVAHLISRLETIASEPPGSPAGSTAVQRTRGRRPVPSSAGAKSSVSPPDAQHYEDVLQQMVDDGNLVIFLGSGLAAGHAGALAGPGSKELAADLARQFGLAPEGRDLPEVAQYVYATRGATDLYRELGKLLTTDCAPGPVHEFLARFPRTLDDLHIDRRYQLIVSTNFDTALEQAFDDRQEPYDLAVYMASGPDIGKFVHISADGGSVPIANPNSYTNLPIGLDAQLERTVIVKIHGAVDGSRDAYSWTDNYVITEDHYIDYLSKSPIESLIPTQVLRKLKASHCLFLGYKVHDWNLRVFLKRIWGGRIDSNSWAVEPDPDMLEKKIWSDSNVELYSADLENYVNLLKESLTGTPSDSAEP